MQLLQSKATLSYVIVSSISLSLNFPGKQAMHPVALVADEMTVPAGQLLHGFGGMEYGAYFPLAHSTHPELKPSSPYPRKHLDDHVTRSGFW